uniref:Uncharacterized protein n=1 Tax=Lepeophtheirus salmonis TaxID=72036 RepID=A0A0K2VDN4_LEPSM
MIVYFLIGMPHTLIKWDNKRLRNSLLVQFHYTSCNLYTTITTIYYDSAIVFIQYTYSTILLSLIIIKSSVTIQITYNIVYKTESCKF